MSYQQLLRETFHRVWHHKKLWLLGLFTAFLGNGGELELVVNNLAQLSPPHTGPSYLPMIFQSRLIPLTLASLSESLTRPKMAITSLVLVLGFLSLIVIGFLAQGVLIRLTPHLRHQNTDLRLWLHLVAVKKLLPAIIFVNIVLRGLALLVISLILFPLGWKLLAATNSSLSVVWLFGLILTPVMLIASFLTKFSVLSLVLSHSPISWLRAIEKSLKQLRSHWLVTLEFVVIMFLVNLAVGTLFLIGATIIAFPLFTVILLLSFLELSLAAWILKIITFTFFLLALILLGAILSTFQYLSWTNFFLNITTNPIKSWLSRRLGLKKI